MGSGPAPASSRAPPAPTSVFPGEKASQLSAHGPVPRANPEARRRARRPPPPPAWTWPTPTSFPAALPLFPWQELSENHATHPSPLSGGNTSGLSGGSLGARPWLLDPDAHPPQALARPKQRAFLNNHHSPSQRSFREGGTNLSSASSREQQGGGAPIRCPHAVDAEPARIPAPELLGSAGPSRNVGSNEPGLLCWTVNKAQRCGGRGVMHFPGFYWKSGGKQRLTEFRNSQPLCLT